MKHNVSNLNRRSATHPLTAAQASAYQASSLRLPSSTDSLEWADVVLRCSLLACLLSAFAICGWHVTPTASQTGESTQLSTRAWSQAVPRVPAFSAVQTDFSIR